VGHSKNNAHYCPVAKNDVCGFKRLWRCAVLAHAGTKRKGSHRTRSHTKTTSRCSTCSSANPWVYSRCSMKSRVFRAPHPHRTFRLSPLLRGPGKGMLPWPEFVLLKRGAHSCSAAHLHAVCAHVTQYPPFAQHILLVEAEKSSVC